MLRRIALIAICAVVATMLPRAAWADSVVIKPIAFGYARHNPTTCVFEIGVLTQASFDRGVYEDNVVVDFDNGGPLGKFDSHALSGAKADNFSFSFAAGSLKPGSYNVTVTWSARTGNGLSRGYAKATTTVDVPEPVVMGKLPGETKCGMRQIGDKYAYAATKFGGAADSVRSGCARCAEGLYRVAVAYADVAESYYDTANDPPDPNFTSLPTVTEAPVAPIAAGETLSAEAAAALTDLLKLISAAHGQSRAALSGVERALGARNAGDKTWEERQTVAAAGFLKALAAKLSQVPAAMDKAGAALKAGGFPNPTVDKTLAATYAANAADHAQDLMVATAGFGDPVPLLDPFGPPGFSQDTATLAGVFTAGAAAMQAEPLRAFGYDQVPVPAKSPTPAPSPTPRPQTPAEQASLVGNGGFEEPALRGAAYQTLVSGKDKTLTGWKLTQGSIDIVASGGLSAGGEQFADLNGNDANVGPGVISQEVAVKRGQGYRLSFKLAGNPNGTPAVKKLQVDVGSKRDTFTFDTTGHTNGDLGWATHTIDYCGSSSSVTITFTSLTEGIRGPNLDSVVFTESNASCSAIPFWVWIIGGVLVIGAVGAAVYFYLRRRLHPAAAPAAAPVDLPSADG